ncbi:hypothetical protein BDZ97DRAFT_48325 [Flammula alnicola]|nr:hypothetical protein BDZ97DRAFT_48325 [Flammula alnicola]
MAIDVASPHTAAAKIIDSPASSCISLEATNRRLGRTDAPDTLWLVHVVKTTRKDKNGASLYQCQFKGCGHEQTKQAVKRHVNDVHFNIRPWICQYCSRPFKQKSSLGIHIHSRHTFENPMTVITVMSASRILQDAISMSNVFIPTSLQNRAQKWLIQGVNDAVSIRHAVLLSAAIHVIVSFLSFLI